jgi:hypothetical protein
MTTAAGLAAAGGVASRFAGGGVAQALITIKAAIIRNVFFMGCLLRLLVDRVGSIPKEKISQERLAGPSSKHQDPPCFGNAETPLTSAIRWRYCPHLSD